MSSSCPERANRPLSLIVAAVTACIPAGAARAADTYVQPSAEAEAQTSTNRDMNPDSDAASDSQGYIAEFGLLVGFASETGETTLRPRLRYQDYTDHDEAEQVEGFFDLRSHYSRPRSEVDVAARYSYRDAFNAELADAEFNPDDPDDPTSPETGDNAVGVVRQLWQLRPDFQYHLTERTLIGGGFLYQGVRYSGEASETRIDYNFGQVQGNLGWALTPQRVFGIGAYASKYDAVDLINETDAYGVSMGLSQDWSETSRTSIEVVYENNDVVTEDIPDGETSSGVGATVTHYWTGEISEWRVVAGRSFTPTSRGGKSTSDQVRVQYDRKLSERLDFMGAVRYLVDESLTDDLSDRNRDYGRATFTLEYALSQTWFVGGGYDYTYQKRESDPSSADDHRFSIRVGYRGLGRDGAN